MASSLVARHALGLPNERKRSYRNRFFAGINHPDYPEWSEMVANGDASVEKSGLHHMFWLTEQGARKALLPGETLDPEDFPASEIRP